MASARAVSDRFVKLTEADIRSFSQEQENVNTKKKTLYSRSSLQVKTKGENQEIPAA